MKKLIIILIFTPFIGFGQCDFYSWYKIPIKEVDSLNNHTQTPIDSLRVISGLFYDDTFLFSGVLVDYYSDGSKKIIWEIKSGLKNGLVIGFNENYTDTCFKYSYIYQYDSYGHKVGNQYEFYTSSEKIPNFNYDFHPKKSYQRLISHCDKTFFGNRDDGFDIFWRNHDSYLGTDNDECSRGSENGKQKCPSGRLHVLYEGLPDLINSKIDLKKSNIPPLKGFKLFTCCYGSTGCFWSLYLSNNKWWFDS